MLDQNAQVRIREECSQNVGLRAVDILDTEGQEAEGPNPGFHASNLHALGKLNPPILGASTAGSARGLEESVELFICAGDLA